MRSIFSENGHERSESLCSNVFERKKKCEAFLVKFELRSSGVIRIAARGINQRVLNGFF